jgi:orotidine-5'-phosphate decarboxylase
MGEGPGGGLPGGSALSAPRGAFASALRTAVLATSPICVGIDPRPRSLPRAVYAGGADPGGLPAKEIAAGYVRFAQAVLEEARGLAAVVKPQAAFFEELLAPGYEAFVQVCRDARNAGFIVIADVKRGDIGSTAEAYANAYLAPRGAEPPVASAVTVNPYLGRDGIDPFVRTAAAHGGGVFVLVKTSNPSSADYQDRSVGERRVFEIVADDVEAMSRATSADGGYGIVGAVTGATHPDEVARLRSRLRSSWLLVPGYGAQGAGARECALAFDADGLGAVVNASRSLNFPWGDAPAPSDWRARIRSAVRQMRDDLARARDTRASIP